MADNMLRKLRNGIALAGGIAAAVTTLPADAAGPASVADLAAPLLKAVVTISTSQTVAASRSAAPTPALPDGSPFQDLFNDFFGNQGGSNQPRRVESLGTGFIVDPSGIIVTNNHVIEDADEITANFSDGTSAKAKVLGIDDKTDLAVIKVEVNRPLPSAEFGDSTQLRIGDWVMAIGNPFGFGGTVTLGIVSARNRDIKSGPYDDFIQTDAAINKGNSGGPLFNMDGKVIGINTAIVSPTGGSIGIGFAIPTEIAVSIIDQLKQYGETRRGWLGVRIQPVTPEVALGLGMPSAKGALIAGVDDPGPAAKAGIMAGDVILSFAGKEIDAVHTLPRLVAEESVDKEVPVVVLRSGKQTNLTVKLGLLDEGKAQVAATTPTPTTPSTPATPNTPATPAPSLGVTGPLGLTLSDLSPAVRDKLGINSSITKGVAVVAVAQGSMAAEKRLAAGDVIVQVDQENMVAPADITKKLDALKKAGRTTAQLVVQNKDGNVRFVNVTIQ